METIKNDLEHASTLKLFLIEHGTGFCEGKSEVLKIFKGDYTQKETNDLLKNSFGIGGCTFLLKDIVFADYFFVEYSSRGIVLKPHVGEIGEREYLYDWSFVSKALRELIQKGKYIDNPLRDKRMLSQKDFNDYFSDSVVIPNERLDGAYSDRLSGEQTKLPSMRKERKEMEIVSFKKEAEPTEVMKRTYEFAKEMADKLKAENKYPTVEYTKQDKTKYTADAKMTIDSFTGKDGKEIGEIKIRDGYQTATIYVNEEGKAFSAKVASYYAKEGKWNNISNPDKYTPALKVFVDFVANAKTAGKEFSTPYVEKEAFTAYVNVKKFINESSPKIDVNGEQKKEFYVSDVRDASFENSEGKKVQMYEFDINGRSDEKATIRINSKGEFSRAEVTHFNGEGKSPTYFKIDGVEALNKMSDAKLADLLNEAVATLPMKEAEHEAEIEADEPELG